MLGLLQKRVSTITIFKKTGNMVEKDKKETKMKSFVLRIDAETMNAIEAWAADEFRSTNGQLQWIIAEALRKNGRKKEKIGQKL